MTPPLKQLARRQVWTLFGFWEGKKVLEKRKSCRRMWCERKKRKRRSEGHADCYLQNPSIWTQAAEWRISMQTSMNEWTPSDRIHKPDSHLVMALRFRGDSLEL